MNNSIVRLQGHLKGVDYMKKETFNRNCPKCNKKLTYTNKKNRNSANKKKSLCASCATKITENDPVHKEKMTAYRRELYKERGNPFRGKKHSDKSKENMKKAQQALDKKNNPIYQSKEFREKSARKGSKNGMYGKTIYGVWLEKYGKEEADRRDKILRAKRSKAVSGKNNPMYGKPSPQGAGNGWSGWYKGWFFRSIRELSYMINVIEAKKLKWRTAETRDLSIKYINYDGTERTYRADFLINEKTMVEVKPIKLFNTPNNLLKKKAAIKFCNKNGYDYKVVDIKLLDINKIVSLYNHKEIKFTKKYEEKYKKYVKRIKNE